MKSMKGGAMDIKSGNQFIRVFDEGDFKELELKQGKRPMTDIKSVVRLDKQGGFKLGNPYEKYQEEKRQAERKTVADFLREVKTQNFLKPKPILLNKNPGGEKPFGINGANVSGFGMSQDYLIRGGTIMSQKAENAIKQKLKRRVEQLNAQEEALKGQPLISQPEAEKLPSEADTLLTELDFTFDDFITSIEQGNLDVNVVGKLQAFFKQLPRTLFLIDSSNLPRFNNYVEQLEIARDNINVIKNRFEVDRPDLVAIGDDLISRIELILVILDDYNKSGIIYEPTQASRKKGVASIFREKGLKRIGNLVARLPPISTTEPEIAVPEGEELQEMLEEEPEFEDIEGVEEEPEFEDIEGVEVEPEFEDIEGVEVEPEQAIQFPLPVRREYARSASIFSLVSNAMKGMRKRKKNVKPLNKLLTLLSDLNNFKRYSREFGEMLPPPLRTNKLVNGAKQLIKYLNETLEFNITGYDELNTIDELYLILKERVSQIYRIATSIDTATEEGEEEEEA